MKKLFGKKKKKRLGRTYFEKLKTENKCGFHSGIHIHALYFLHIHVFAHMPRFCLEPYKPHLPHTLPGFLLNKTPVLFFFFFLVASQHQLAQTYLCPVANQQKIITLPPLLQGLFGILVELKQHYNFLASLLQMLLEHSY